MAPARPVDATPSAINLFIKGGVYGATETGEAFRMQRDDMWSRWKMGQSLPQIGRAFGKSHMSIQFVLSQHGGIVPAARRRSLLTHTLTEREDISRGIASGWSIRDIARGLERAVSTVSREVARYGGRPQYRANEADHRAWESALRPKACLLAIH